MSSSSDPLFNRYQDEDFADARPVAEIPALAQLQAEQVGKSRITIRIDNEILTLFKQRAQETGGSYQTLMNHALRQFAQGFTLAEVVRETIRQELHRV